jgi:hypothetical protein
MRAKVWSAANDSIATNVRNGLMRPLLAIALFSIGGCASTSMSSFRDPQYLNHKCERIAVIVGSSNLMVRAELEQKMVRSFREDGVFAIAGTQIFPPTRTIADSTIAPTLLEKGIDSYLLIAPGAYGVEDFALPSLTSGHVRTSGNVSVFQFVQTQNSVEKPYASHRVMLVDSKNNQVMWIADSFTGGNGLADFSTVNQSFCREVTRRLRAQGFIGAPATAASASQERHHNPVRSTPEVGAPARAPFILGVRIASTPVALARSSGLSSRLGVLVTAVPDGTLAQTLGLREGDIIVRLGGLDVDSPDEFDAAKLEYPLLTPIRVEVWRDNQMVPLTVDWPETPPDVEARNP